MSRHRYPLSGSQDCALRRAGAACAPHVTLRRAGAALVRGLLAGVCLGTLAHPAQSATRALDPLVQVDRLGYRCIPEDQLEAAFASSGKGAYLPRTCLADPCATAPEEALLAWLLGRPPTEPEIDDFRQRHIALCAPQGRKFPPGSEPWLPILDGTPPEMPPPRPPGLLPPPPVPPPILYRPPPPIFPAIQVIFPGPPGRPRTPPEIEVGPRTVFGGVPPRVVVTTSDTPPPGSLPVLGTTPPLPLDERPAPVPLPGALLVATIALATLRLLRLRKH